MPVTHTLWKFMCLAGAMLLVSGCAAPKNYLVLLDGEDGAATGAVVIENKDGARTLNQAGHSIELAGKEAAKAVEDNRIEDDFKAALSAQPLKPKSFLLYFEFGGATLTSQSKALFPDIIAELKSRPAPDIAIIGHTDTAGNANSNAELGLKRASSVETLLVVEGVDASLIVVSSHGERNPLVKTADGVNEARNRRVQVVIR